MMLSSAAVGPQRDLQVCIARHSTSPRSRGRWSLVKATDECRMERLRLADRTGSFRAKKIKRT